MIAFPPACACGWRRCRSRRASATGEEDAGSGNRRERCRRVLRPACRSCRPAQWRAWTLRHPPTRCSVPGEKITEAFGLRDYASRIRRRGKPFKVAITAVMRKLITAHQCRPGLPTAVSLCQGSLTKQTVDPGFRWNAKLLIIQSGEIPTPDPESPGWSSISKCTSSLGQIEPPI